jgi:hypothetical protein
MQEEFRTIKNYDGLYQISNLGRVKNLISGLVLKNTLHKTIGYYVVGLRKNDETKIKRVHILLAQAFIQNAENKNMVDHIDKDRANNNIDNLRWATSSQNSMNKSKSSDNTSGYSGVYFYKNTNKWIAQLRKDGKKYTKSFKTIEEAIEYRLELERIHFGIYSPNYKPPTIINNYITNNITNNIQNVQTLINQIVKSEAQELEELEKEFEQAMK